MADIAASVLARLKNKAKESGRSYQLCLQLFCQEEFLRRLERSKYAENLVLKGGLFIYALTDFDSRVTVDVDFLLRQIPNTPEQLKAVLEEIIASKTGNDFVTFEIKDVAPIAVTKKYAGIGAPMIARIKNTRTPFGIDFGVGDVIVPKQEKRKIPTQLADFEAPTVNTYSTSGADPQENKRRIKNEASDVHKLRLPAAVPERGDGGEGAGGVHLVRLRADARGGFPGAANWKPADGPQGEVHPVGGRADGR